MDFKKNWSTASTAYKYTQKILDTLSKRHYAIALLLDMTNAYDKVQYPILRKYGIGIRGVVRVYKWLESLLRKRVQYVDIEF